MNEEELEEYENKIVMQEESKLQKEAENYLNQNCKRWESDSLCVDDIAIENYLAGAEPREKRITELEQQIEKMKSELKADNEARKFAMAMSEKVEKQLREVNAELKEENARLNRLSDMQDKTVVDLTKTCEQRREQLTKAKEIINEYVSILKGDTKNWKKTQEKAEQFLSEESK